MHSQFAVRRTIKLIETAILLFLGLSFSAFSYGDSSVWKVSSGDNTLYLGGTVHLLRPSDYPLPPEYEEAYGEADELYFETDIAAMSDLTVQAQMLQQLTYTDGRTLATVLNEEAYQALTDYTASVGLPLTMLESFKPGMIVSTLQVLEFQKMGFTPQGVDTYFNTRAMGEAKDIGALETLEEQIGFLAAMGEGNESEFILMSLTDLEETDEIMEEMISAWRSGDSDALEELFVDDMRERAPELYDSLLRQRNFRWMPQIEAMMDDSDTEFVLVGAAHLIGPDGLVDLLREAGYEVSQL
ncbi:MAG: TraB/GumN family protein [Gammaproteobacteria bacterium]